MISDWRPVPGFEGYYEVSVIGQVGVTEYMRRCPIDIDSLFDALPHAFHRLFRNGLFASANDKQVVGLGM